MRVFIKYEVAPVKSESYKQVKAVTRRDLYLPSSEYGCLLISSFKLRNTGD